MKLTQQQLNAALAAGLVLTNPAQSETPLPVKHSAGVLVLYEVLSALATGKLMLIQNPVHQQVLEQPEDSEDPEEAEDPEDV